MLMKNVATMMHYKKLLP